MEKRRPLERHLVDEKVYFRRRGGFRFFVVADDNFYRKTKKKIPSIKK